MKISITLPSIYPDRAEQAIANINATCHLPHEIVVVSPFKPAGNNVLWIEETCSAGVAAAQWRAALHSTGDYITATADDYYYVDGWDVRLLDDFNTRECLCLAPYYVMGVRFGVGVVGTCFGLYYPNFPFMSRETFIRIGWISPDYKRGFGDCDLGMRVWYATGLCEFSNDDLLQPIRMSDGNTLDGARKEGNLCTDDDMALFLDRWSDRFGLGWDTSTLRGFNLDVGMNLNPELFRDGRTICMNSPEFVTKFYGQ